MSDVILRDNLLCHETTHYVGGNKINQESHFHVFSKIIIAHDGGKYFDRYELLCCHIHNLVIYSQTVNECK